MAANAVSQERGCSLGLRTRPGLQVGSYAPGAMLGFERSRAMRHPKSVYEALLQSCKVFGGNHLVVERMWVMLFAGTDFRDNPIHHAL